MPTKPDALNFMFSKKLPDGEREDDGPPTCTQRHK
jgi:hypothetical protein